MGLLDAFYSNSDLAKRDAMLAAYRKQKSIDAAQAQLGLIPDPTTGQITPAAQRPSTPQDVLGAEVFQQRPPGRMPTNLLGLQQGYDQRRQDLLGQAMPEQTIATMQSRAQMAPYLASLPEDQRALASANLPEYTKRRIETAMPNKLPFEQLLAARNALPEGDPMREHYDALIKKEEYNGQAATLAEQRRHNLTDEGLNSTAVVDDGVGGKIVYNKATKKFATMDGKPYNGGMPDFNAPPTGPAGVGGTPPLITNPGAAQPQPVADDEPLVEGTPSRLGPDIEARIAQLPAAYQANVRGVLSGRTKPPEGTVLKDPYWRTLLGLANRIDPKFDETQWAARNRMAVNTAGTANDSFGGRIDSAKKLINHATDLIDSAADLDNTHGGISNWIGNASTDAVGTGADTAVLNNYRGYKEGVGDEFTKLMAGSAGAEGAKERAGKLISENAPLPGQAGGVGAVINMMEGQVQPLADQYNQVMGTNYPLDYFLGKNEAAKLKVLKEISADAKAGKPITQAIIRERLAGIKKTAADAPPTGIDAALWKHMTPEERALWKKH